MTQTGLKITMALFLFTLTIHAAEPQTHIVKVKAPISTQQLKELLNQSQQQAVVVSAQPLLRAFHTRVNHPLAGFFKLRLTSNLSQDDLLVLLNQHPAVTWAEPDHVATLSGQAEKRDSQWGMNHIQVYDAWDELGGAPDPTETPVIAVIDSGVDLNHTDLESRFWTNDLEQHGIPNVDDDGNGYVDDIHGWDWIHQVDDQGLRRPGSSPDFMRDEIGHGTHCAAIAAANREDGVGRDGVCYFCNIMTLKVFDQSGTATVSQIAEAVMYAARNGADIISMSFSLRENTMFLEGALSYAATQAVLVAAAGNNGLARNEVPFYPAAYPFVLGVEALARNGQTPAPFSNHGYELTMPGEDVFSAAPGDMNQPEGRFATWSGTSMAAPFAAGVAGLAAAFDPNADSHRLFTLLLQSGAHAWNTLTNPLAAGRLSFREFQVIDESTGNADGLLEERETAILRVIYRNMGEDLPALSATLTSLQGPPLSIAAATTLMPPVDAGDNAWFDFPITLNALTPSHGDIHLQIQVVTPYGTETNNLTIRPARVRSGKLASQTWLRDNLYLVRGGLVVGSGATLTIEPGAQVRLEQHSSFRIQGRLDAAGEIHNPIVFELGPRVTTWAGLDFNNTDSAPTYDAYSGDYLSGNRLQYCHFNTNRPTPTATAIKAAGAHLYRNHFRDWHTAVDFGATAPANGTLLLENTFQRNHIAVANYHMGLPLNLGKRPKRMLLNEIRNNAFVENIAASIQIASHNGEHAVKANHFIKNPACDPSLTAVEIIDSQEVGFIPMADNFWGTDNPMGLGKTPDRVQVTPVLVTPGSSAPPTVVAVTVNQPQAGLFDQPLDGPLPPMIEEGSFELTVTFSKPMNTNSATRLSFGNEAPFNEALIAGDWDNDTVWRGTGEATRCSGMGVFNLALNDVLDQNGQSTVGVSCSFRFMIDLSGLSVTSSDSDGQICFAVSSSFAKTNLVQDLCPSILGYNLYRGQTEHGPFERLNTNPQPQGMLIDAAPTACAWYKVTMINASMDEITIAEPARYQPWSAGCNGELPPAEEK